MSRKATRGFDPGDARVVAGVDEAGLGPLLGPLTVGFSAFRVEPGEPCLWRRLQSAVSADLARDRDRLVVGDSKRVFARNPRGRRRLELTVLGFLAQQAACPTSGRALLDASPEALRTTPEHLASEPWCDALAGELPLWCERGSVELARGKLNRALARGAVEVLDLGVRLVTTRELNRAFVDTNNKAAAHWGWVSSVLEHLWQRHAHEGLHVVTDRQGGRFRYGPLLAARFPGAEVRVLGESPQRSEYLVLEPRAERRMHLCFAEGAEDQSLGVALASCLAKYTREVCMEAFNAYFSALQPGLQPTAGYTSDGRRWMTEAAPAIVRAGLVPEALLRSR